MEHEVGARLDVQTAASLRGDVALERDGARVHFRLGKESAASAGRRAVRAHVRADEPERVGRGEPRAGDPAAVTARHVALDRAADKCEARFRGENRATIAARGVGAHRRVDDEVPGLALEVDRAAGGHGRGRGRAARPVRLERAAAQAAAARVDDVHRAAVAIGGVGTEGRVAHRERAREFDVQGARVADRRVALVRVVRERDLGVQRRVQHAARAERRARAGVRVVVRFEDRVRVHVEAASVHRAVAFEVRAVRRERGRAAHVSDAAAQRRIPAARRAGEGVHDRVLACDREHAAR